jgi:hypothetical protein
VEKGKWKRHEKHMKKKKEKTQKKLVMERLNDAEAVVPLLEDNRLCV